MSRPSKQDSSSSKQGEHVFNAVGDLALGQVEFLTGSINPKAPNSERDAAAKAIKKLQACASAFNAARANQVYGTAPQGEGDKQNSHRYSLYAKHLTEAIKSIVEGSPSEMTRAYTGINHDLNNLERHVVDEKAKVAAKNQLNEKDGRDFDK